MHFHAWKQGLKTGCYYLRTKAPVMAQKFTVDPRMIQGAVAQVTDDSSGSESDDELTPEEKKAKTRADLLAKLAKEYEDASKKSDDANSEGCTLCSA
jgi:hypothetical protein